MVEQQPQQSGAAHFEGRYNARFTKLTAIQINPFVKFLGLEFFGIYELASDDSQFITGTTQVIDGGMNIQ